MRKFGTSGMQQHYGAHQDGGFTLMELLAVLVILGLVASLASAMIPNSLSARKMEVQLLNVQQLLITSRAAAANAGVPVRITLDSSGALSTSTSKKAVLPAGIAASFSTAEQKPLPEYVFYPDGSSRGGQVILQKGDMQRRLIINGLTSAIVPEQVTP
jgi:general secretion pathway protein H